jgi:hypothetical protein
MLGQEDLRHIARHHGQVSAERGQLRGIALDPGDSPGRILRSRHLDRCRGRVDAHHGMAGVSEPDGQASCPAAHVKDPVRAQFPDDAQVGSQVIAVSVESVVDGC